MRAIDFSRQCARRTVCRTWRSIGWSPASASPTRRRTRPAAPAAPPGSKKFRRAQATDAPLLDEIPRAGSGRGRAVVPLRRRVWLATVLPLLAAAAILLLLLPRLLRPGSDARKGRSALALDVVVATPTARSSRSGRTAAYARATRSASGLDAAPRSPRVLGLDSAGTVSVYVSDGADPHRSSAARARPCPAASSSTTRPAPSAWSRSSATRASPSPTRSTPAAAR